MVYVRFPSQLFLISPGWFRFDLWDRLGLWGSVHFVGLDIWINYITSYFSVFLLVIFLCHSAYIQEGGFFICISPFVFINSFFLKSFFFFFFWLGPFSKALLNLLQYCFCFMLSFFFFGHKRWDLSSLTKNWTCIPFIGRQSPNH